MPTTDTATTTASRSAHRAGTPAWLLAGLAVAVPVLGLSACGRAGISLGGSSHPVTSHRAWNGSVRAVDVGTANGSITIVGSSQQGATVDGSGSRGSKRPSNAETLKDGTLSIESTCPSTIGSSGCTLSFRVAVPATATVTAHTGNGTVTVSGITAATTLTTVDGTLAVTAPAGPLQLTNMDGATRVTAATSARASITNTNGPIDLGFATPPTAVSAQSSNGPVTISLPKSPASYRVAAKSTSGHVTTSVRTSAASTRQITATTANGAVTVQYA